MKKTTTERNIFQQGELDGFCLLYAVLNAFNAVCPKMAKPQLRETAPDLWSRMISVTPSLQNFASVGSLLPKIPKTNLDVSIKQSLLNQYAEILSVWTRQHTDCKKVAILPVALKTEEWCDSILNQSLPDLRSWICCLKAGSGALKYDIPNEHWIAIVGSTESGPAVACSYTSHERKTYYEELSIGRGQTRRFYNNIITSSLTKKSIFEKSRYELTIS